MPAQLLRPSRRHYCTLPDFVVEMETSGSGLEQIVKPPRACPAFSVRCQRLADPVVAPCLVNEIEMKWVFSSYYVVLRAHCLLQISATWVIYYLCFSTGSEASSSIAVRPSPKGQKGEAQDGSSRCNAMELCTCWSQDVFPMW